MIGVITPKLMQGGELLGQDGEVVSIHRPGHDESCLDPVASIMCGEDVWA